jgi:putative transposase
VIYRTDEDALTREIVTLASEYGRCGYRRITALLRDRGWHVGNDRVQRIWRREGLKVPQKQRRLRLRPERANHVWSYDFVSAMTHDGRTLRMLTLIDEYTRECLAIRVARRLGRYEVIEALADVMLCRGIPENTTDTEDDSSRQRPRVCFEGARPMAYRNGVKLDFSRPGKPTDNAYVESFNGSLRDECLNVNWFLSMEDARGKIEAWRRHYNETRPHSALEDVPPREFASKGGASPALAGSARPGIFTP